MTLNVGRIDYVNCAPFFHYLGEAGFTGAIVAGVPSALNRMLATGVIDACPSSSFEYALHNSDYLLLPGHSISSLGPVQSVLLFTPETGSLADQNIALTGESATSVNLLQVLLKEFCGVERVRCEVPDGPVEDVLGAGGSALLIGDRALRAAQQVPAGMRVVDLGALWYHYTGLPFVFALWIVRRDACRTKPQALQAFVAQLQRARETAMTRLPDMAAELAAGSCLDPSGLMRYWQSMSYDLTAGHLEGLRLFYTLSHKHGLLERLPEFGFWPEDEGLRA